MQAYNFLLKSPLTWYCINRLEDIVPFGNISNEQLFKRKQGPRTQN